MRTRWSKLVHDDLRAFWALVITGAVISLGKLLAGGEKITLRLAAGRIILGSATSLVAGMLLLQIHDISPLALLGTGSALGIAGAQAVEVAMSRWGGKS